MSFIFTSESVGRGHPDKLADQISDAIVDYALTNDSEARTAIETMLTTNQVILCGEFRMKNPPNRTVIEEVVQKIVQEVGYNEPTFNSESLVISNYLHEQSPDIAMGVDANREKRKEEGAGDQGIMFGFANKETEVFMPAAIYYAHRIVERLEEVIREHNYPYGPDMKSQVSLIYDDDGHPTGIHTVLVSLQHKEYKSLEDVREFVTENVKDIFPESWGTPDHILINPTGRFVVGGPHGDAGLTGRKIIVDTYGGYAPHGGGAFSGKDPSKQDRSAAYMARYVAKNIVAAGLADRALIQVAYAIGMSKPISLLVNTFGTGVMEDEKLSQLIHHEIPLSPNGIRTALQLNKPIYVPTAYHGHFGRHAKNGFFPWEKLTLVDQMANWR